MFRPATHADAERVAQLLAGSRHVPPSTPTAVRESLGQPQRHSFFLASECAVQISLHPYSGPTTWVGGAEKRGLDFLLHRLGHFHITAADQSPTLLALLATPDFTQVSQQIASALDLHRLPDVRHPAKVKLTTLDRLDPALLPS